MAKSTVIEITEVSDLVSRITELHQGDKRLMIGITGEPGAGKSTLGAALNQAFASNSTLVGMDGYHLAQNELRRLNREERKGAPDTFDAWGYVSLLERLRERTEPVVYAPQFDRSQEEPIACAIPVPKESEIIFTEGNYLLLKSDPWIKISNILDEIWYVSPDNDVRLQRLIDRHMEFGRSLEAATERSNGSDEINAQLIRSQRDRADIIVNANTVFLPQH